MISIETGNPLQELAQRLVQKFDTNGDGQLTAKEFGTFLSTFMGAIGGNKPAVDPGSTQFQPQAPIGGGTGRGVLEGYDTRKLGDPGVTTVKYLFGRIAQNYDLSSVTDMASAESLLTSMKGQMQAAGITVLEVSKDKIKVLDDAGQPAWIDVIRGAGAPGAAWQWMDTRF